MDIRDEIALRGVSCTSSAQLAALRRRVRTGRYVVDVERVAQVMAEEMQAAKRTGIPCAVSGLFFPRGHGR